MISSLNNCSLETKKLDVIYGNQITNDFQFIDINGCLYKIPISSIIETINGIQIDNIIIRNYTIPSNVTKLSDYCFANCLELTEIKGLEHIKEYGKCCFLNCPKLDQEQYPIVKQNNEQYYKNKIDENEKKQFEEWTGLKCNDIIFDSNIDDWSIKTSVFNERIMGKSKLIFVIEDEEGEKFGYYSNTEIVSKHSKTSTKQNTMNMKSFHFNLHSNGRLKQPMKFKMKQITKSDCKLYSKENDFLIGLGNIVLCKKHKKNESYCWQYNNVFDYSGIDCALCGRKYPNTFTVKRIVVVQMK